MGSSRKYPCPAPRERLMEFPRGRWVQFKKPSMVGVWIFSETTQYEVIIHDLHCFTFKMFVVYKAQVF